MLIDVHCHLTGREYERVGGVTAVLDRARAAGVKAVVCSAFDMDSSYRAAELANRFADVYFCAGFQPQELKKYRDGDLERIAALANHPKCVGIGEIGLDYHYPDQSFEGAAEGNFRAADTACGRGGTARGRS